MTAAPSTMGRMFAAFAYLQVVSLWNAVRQRARRLRQPKYFFGALVAVAYVYFFIVRNAARAGAFGASPAGGSLLALMPSFVALGLLATVLLAWLLPGDRASLRFSEAEVAFLFPAPLTRRALINYSLLRAQLAIFASAFLLTLVLGRGRALPGSAWQHATGLWLLMATLRLHFLGASFAHERLLGSLRPAARYAIAAAAAVLVAVGVVWWVRGHVAPPPARAVDFAATSRWLASVFAAPALPWVLTPFRWLAAPLFAPDTQAWLRSLAPAFALLALHYAWVVYSHVSFEEASMDRARRRAERVQAMRAGQAPFARTPTGPRSAPFVLAPSGFVPTAFLWKGLVAAGPVFRLRYWLLACALILAATQWPWHRPAWLLAVLQVMAVVSASLSAWLLLAGPMFVMRGLRQVFESLDILKAAPLRGWQIALGQLLTPTAILVGVQWLMLLLATSVLAPRFAAALGGGAALWAATIGYALLLAPVCMLMQCVPFAGMLLFPAMAVAFSSRSAGLEVAGQRLIFVFGLLLALALALVPAFLLGGIAFLLVKWLANATLGIAVATVAALAVVGVELAFALMFLGQRIDRFDVSQELR
jgi:hypothetical protein